MAALVTPADVRAIIDTDADDPTLNICINGADLFIKEQLAPLGTVSVARQTEIERWLSAHILAMTSLEYRINDVTVTTREEIKGAGTFGDFLRATMWGQTALMFDTSGTLASIGKMKASIKIAKMKDFNFGSPFIIIAR